MTLPTADVLGMIYGASEFGLSIWKRSKGKGASSDSGSLRLLWSTILASIAGGFLVARYLPEFSSSVLHQLRPVGLTLYVAGIILRWYAIFYLGRFFTVDVAIASDHRVVDSGPYRFICHPSYSGALLALTGFGMYIGNTLSLAIIVIPITCAFAIRIRIEETALLRALGEPYAAYSKRTKRLVPGLF